MPLKDTAYLQIDDGSGTTATFELWLALDETTEGQKNYIMADRGQYIQEIANQLVNTISVDDITDRRTGYTIDGGAGSESRTITFKSGLDPAEWGDGSGGDGPDNVTKTDASGLGVHPLDRKDVMNYWLRRTRTDSFGQARLHWGQWTDGTVGSASAGVYGEPIPVSVLSWTLQTPDLNEDINSLQGTLELKRVALFPLDAEDVPDWVANPAQKFQNLIDGVNE